MASGSVETRRSSNRQDRRVEVKIEEQIPAAVPQAKKLQNPYGPPPGFEQPRKSTKKGKKPASEGPPPGTPSRGRRPSVGICRPAKFSGRFMKRVTGNPYGPIKMPKSFSKNITAKLPFKIIVANSSGNSWEVRLREWGERVFIDHGWDEFVQSNNVEEGDHLFFDYTLDSSITVLVFGKNGCEKSRPRD